MFCVKYLRPHCQRTCRLAITLGFALAFLATPGQAQLFYDLLDTGPFAPSGTGEVLATIELAQLPASRDDLVGVTFTPAGEAIFGLGPVYMGAPDRMIALTIGGGDVTLLVDEPGVLDDGNGGLVVAPAFALVQWTDDDPDYSSFPPDGGPPANFNVAISDGTTQPHGILAQSTTGGSPAIAIGEWRRVVPEPSSVALLGLALAISSGTRNARRASAVVFQ